MVGTHTVYVTYGKLWLVVVATATAYAFTVRKERAPTGAERCGWPLALAGYVVLIVGLLVTYWTPLLELGFAFLVAPGMLLSVIGSTVRCGRGGRRAGR
ncbi:MAG: hypothetical protein M3O70_02215 [Actinomycetota bacterium]|nr:hypothetical protein [Actinomycetota bacterium]